MEINLFANKIYFSKIKIALLVVIAGAILAIGFFFFFVYTTSDTNAINTCSTGWRVNSSASKTIDCRTICKVVSNSSSGNPTFVPTAYKAQWQSFINSPPNAISLSACSSGSSDGGGSPPSPPPSNPPAGEVCSSTVQCGASYSTHTTNRCVDGNSCGAGVDWSTSCSLLCNYANQQTSYARHASDCTHQHIKRCDASTGVYCWTLYQNKTEVLVYKSCVM